MRKVLKFVKGKRDEKKDHGSANLGPFSMEITTPSPGTPGDDDHYMPFDQGCNYTVDISGKDKTVTKLHKAAWLGNVDKLKSSLKKVDIDALDRLNRTPLHLAAARGNTNIVWFLLNNKAKTTICDNEGRTPFLKAIECGHKDVIQLMLERGTDLNTVDYGGNSCLHIAAKQGFYDIASIILKQGGNFETSNSQGEFPLHIATCCDHRELVELILRYNSSVNVVDRDNRSPLMFAARNGNMPLVQLFLEYGAQRRVMDSNDWTAEDYAQQAGHLDIAAELKSPSDLVEQNTSAELELTPEPLSSTKRSISPTPNKREEKDKDVDSDTWNSQPSESGSKRISGSGLMKFLPPPSDEEISEEESIHSPKADAKDSEGTQDSPRSCVIPPPCKPPRSWDLIQAGMIDDHQTSSEPRRRSLLTLGSLRSKRESFTESPNAESPSFHGDGPHVGRADADQWVTSQSFIKQDSTLQSHRPSCDGEKSRSNGKVSPNVPELEIEGKELFLPDHRDDANIFAAEKNVGGSDSGSDWDSDASLPMDNFPVHIPSKPLSDDRTSPVIVLDDVKVDEKMEEPSKELFKFSSAPSDKKGRFLLRVPPIDLTDEDVEFGKEIEKEKHKSDHISEGEKKTISSSTCGTFGRDGTLQGYDEMWEANAHLSNSNPGFSGPSSSNSIAQSIEETLPQTNLSSNNLLLEDELIFPSPQLPDKGRSDSPGSVLSPIVPGHKLKTSTSLEFKKQTLATYLEGKSNNMKYESHSLDNLDDPNEKPKPQRKHFRQMSVSAQSWRSEEIYHNPIIPPPLTNLDRMLPDNKRISAQLECYDEALRELAQVTVVKKQGSLPTVNANEPHSARFSGARKQRYLSLPRTNELIDEAFKEMGQSSVKTMQRGSLSLPRNTTPKDMIDLGHQSAPVSRGSSSLPRTATSKDMISEAHPIPPPRRRRSLQTKRADSEGEVRKSRDSLVRPLSLDVKLHKIETTMVKLSQPHKISIENIISVKSPIGDENLSPNSSETPPSSVRRISIEKPIRKKRKMLLAMRGLNHQSLNNSQSSVVSVEESFEEPPFWMSTDRGDGLLPRQTTVIERLHFGRVDTCGVSPISSGSPVGVGSPKEPLLENLAIGPCEEEIPKDVADNDLIATMDRQHSSFINKMDEECDELLSLPAPPEFNSSASGSDFRSYRSIEADVKYDRTESPENQRYSPSDESGVSQSDVTPQHQAVKSHHSLLQQHLRATTAEKSRLEETAAKLGEKTEKLKYELADALEASRSRDEVISLLQGQLKSMEDMYTKCLEEVQRYRLILANQEQELSHLKDMCNKYDEEKTHMAEIIRSKETDSDKATECRDEDKKWEITVELKEREKQHHELQIRLKYLEQEKQKSLDDIMKLEKKNEELEKKLELSCNKIQVLSEEKTVLSAKTSVDLNAMQADAQKWNQLYESCLLNLEQMAAASKETGARIELKNNKEWMSVEAYREELRDLIRKLQDMKEQDSLAWKNKIQEEISNAALLLRNEYTKVENAIAKHNEQLEALVKKLQQDLENTSTRQAYLESELGQARDELKEASRSNVELATATVIQELRQVNSELREQTNRVKTQFEVRDEDLKKKLENLNETCNRSDTNFSDTLETIENLRKENRQLKLTIEELRGQNAMQLNRSSTVHSFQSPEQVIAVHEVVSKDDKQTPHQSTELMKQNAMQLSDSSTIHSYQSPEQVIADHEVFPKDDEQTPLQSTYQSDYQASPFPKESRSPLRVSRESLEYRDETLVNSTAERGNLSVQTFMTFPTHPQVSVERVIGDEDGNENVKTSEGLLSKPSASSGIGLQSQASSQRPTHLLYDNSNNVLTQPESKDKFQQATLNNELKGSWGDVDLINENNRLKLELDKMNKDFKIQEEELKRTLVVLKDTRNAATVAAARDCNDFKRQLEEMNHKLQQSEKELIEIKRNLLEKSKVNRPTAIEDEEDEPDATSFGLVPKDHGSRTESKEKASPKNSKFSHEDTPYVGGKNRQPQSTLFNLYETNDVSTMSNLIPAQNPDTMTYPAMRPKSNQDLNAKPIPSGMSADASTNTHITAQTSNIGKPNDKISFDFVSTYEESRTESKEKASPKNSKFSNDDTSFVGGNNDQPQSKLFDIYQSNDVSEVSRQFPAKNPNTTCPAMCPKPKPIPSGRYVDATTSTYNTPETPDLYQELQLAREKLKRNKETITKLRSDIHVLKATCSDRNIGTSKCSITNNDDKQLSPGHWEQLVAEFQRKVSDMELKVKDETAKRFALEVQVKKMNYDLHEKVQLEKELDTLHRRLDKDFVSRYELEQMRKNYEEALKQARLDAERRAREDINAKMDQINNLVEKKVDEKLHKDLQRTQEENQIREEFKETRLKLAAELVKVQATLMGKNEDQKQLRDKCDRSAQESKCKRDQCRQKLVERSYNVNLTQPSNIKEKEVPPQVCMAPCNPLRPHPQRPPPSACPGPTVCPADNPFSEMLRNELEKSIRKHTQPEPGQASSSRNQQPKTASEEHMELLRKKYFLH